ncbi:D-alanine--D-alanine ligase [uncultured Oscillibacter sp.]|uniref:D-alanine--D-alanine ligase family protein n=1 Tax=uncultured Oscillibacter sp. TaxID=876091 RepID=UPI0025FE0036|nr:D-alanine--D-alanine ligase [uncultured Oscillibacter sp.]
MKIVVLAGGLSTERAVSLVTGATVCRALRERGHRAILVDLFLGPEEEPEDLESLFDAADGLCPDAKIEAQAPDLDAVRARRRGGGAGLFGPRVLELCGLADLVFLGLHGQDGEDGRVQAAFDLLGIRYTGSGYLGSGLAMDKVMTKRMMDAAGIPTPRWRLLEYGPGEIPRLAAELPMPCVIKTSGGGSSLGVFLPEDREALAQALEQVRAFGGKVLWEERIYGRELTVGVLGERALPAVEIVPAEREFDYAAKYQAGGARELCPAPITAEQQAAMGELALKLHRTLGLEVYSRTDFLMDGQGRFWCLEVNSLPGMTAASLVPKEAAAVGMSYGELCEEIVRQSYALKRRA